MDRGIFDEHRLEMAKGGVPHWYTIRSFEFVFLIFGPSRRVGGEYEGSFHITPAGDKSFLMISQLVSGTCSQYIIHRQ